MKIPAFLKFIVLRKQLVNLMQENSGYIFHSKYFVRIVDKYFSFEAGRPTGCVTGAGAGVDSAWEQRKLEARKMLENAAESPASSARFVGRRGR
jgi:hypothetical protein